MAALTQDHIDIIAGALVDNAVCCNLVVGRFSAVRKLKKDEYDVGDAEKGLTSASKIALDCPELTAIRKFDDKTRDYLRSYSLGTPFKSGIFTIPVRAVERIQARLVEREEERAELVSALMDVYDERVTDMQIRLNSRFKASDYPTRTEMTAAFYMRWNWVDLRPSDKLGRQAFAEEKAKVVSLWEQAATDAIGLLREQFAAEVARWADRLAGKEDGKPKVFRDSMIKNMGEFLEAFDLRNVMDDKDLAELVERAKELTNGVTPDMLRSSEMLRDRVRDGFSEIKSKADELMQDAPRRAMSFDDD